MSERSPATHTYRTSLRWTGSTAPGYDAYDRTHRLRADPADASLALSSDRAFRGDPDLLNPEQLLVAAASSCQLLSFLAVAARARLDVVGYEDEATAVMPEDDPPMRLTQIVLRPVITVVGTDGGHPTDERLAHLVRGGPPRVLHRQQPAQPSCSIEPTFVRRA